MSTLRVLTAVGLAAFALVACSGGSSSTPIVTNPAPIAPAAPVAPAGTQMNPLTSYTVYVGSVNGTDVVTELSVLSTASAPNPNGFYVGVAPADMLTSGTPVMPTSAPGALIVFPDGSVVVADMLGNFDASQAPYTLANQPSIAAGQQVEVVVDPSQSPASGAALAAPADTFVDVDEPAGGAVTASTGRSILAASPPPPVVLAKLQVQPASAGMFDKEQRTYFAIGFDKNRKKVALGKQNVSWSVANCNGAAAAGKLQPSKETSYIIYSAPATGNAGNCPDILTASYTNPAGASPSAPLKATAKAFYAAHDTAVLYSGKVVDQSGKPVAKAIVDFFGSTASSSAGRFLAITDKDGKFSRKIPSGRTPSFLVANRVSSGGKVSYVWYNVTVTAPSPNATTGLTLTETTQAVHPPHGV